MIEHHTTQTSVVLVRELMNVFTLNDSTVNGGGVVCSVDMPTESNPSAIHSILHQLNLLTGKPR